MYKLEYLKLAKDDINEIIHYISYNLNNKSAARKFTNEFIKNIDNIIKFPYSNPEYQTIKPLKRKYRVCRVKKIRLMK